MDSFDTEAFICEVQATPAIWDTSSVDYSNRERKKTCLALRKRWKNLRGSFARELQRRKSLKSGSGATRKSQYIYFNQLSFLRTVVSTRESTQAEDPDENEEEEEAASRAVTTQIASIIA
ncbi:uncharacterized protein LOC124622824 [Schistocerca americana]|uniref:uncharacterized protein LOC124622824 n=1 Tax=Schistocerca americana TaxID=7009 RepID=UPI001F4F93A8|nr:uncharacterized protein LOC124622824 [Schistocerca americana]